MIETAIDHLYGSWEGILQESIAYIQDAIRNGNYSKRYSSIVAEGHRTKDILIDFEQEHSGVANKDNLDRIIRNLKAKQADRTSMLKQLREKKEQDAALPESFGRNEIKR